MLFPGKNRIIGFKLDCGFMYCRFFVSIFSFLCVFGALKYVMCLTVSELAVTNVTVLPPLGCLEQNHGILL